MGAVRDTIRAIFAAKERELISSIGAAIMSGSDPSDLTIVSDEGSWRVVDTKSGEGLFDITADEFMPTLNSRPLMN